MEWQLIDTAPKDGTTVLLFTHWGGDEIVPDPFDEIQLGYWDAGNITGDIWVCHIASPDHRPGTRASRILCSRFSA